MMGTNDACHNRNVEKKRIDYQRIAINSDSMNTATNDQGK